MEYEQDYNENKESIEEYNPCEVAEEELEKYEQMIKKLWNNVVEKYVKSNEDTVIAPDIEYDEFYNFMISRSQYTTLMKTARNG